MGIITELLKQLAAQAGKVITKHYAEILIGSAIVAASGTAASICAECKNSKAKKMVQESVNNYEKVRIQTEKNIESLGMLKLEIYSSFNEFSNSIEKIKDPPNYLLKDIETIEFPHVIFTDKKELTANSQTAISGGIGITGGTIAGIAIFGLSGPALVSGLTVGSLFVCVKGFSLLNKSVKNMKQANSLCSELRMEKLFLIILDSNALRLWNRLKKVHSIYENHLEEMHEILDKKHVWKNFSSHEKLVIKNTILLTSLLLRMCEVKLIKVDEQNQRNECDMDIVTFIGEEANQIIKQINESEGNDDMK